MDRREFLKSSGVAAAAATTAGATAATAATSTVADIANATNAVASPAVVKGTREIVLSLAKSLETLDTGLAAHRLANRIEAAFDGRVRVPVITSIGGGLETVSTGAADLAIGSASLNASYHSAFHVFGALPTGEHMDGSEQHAWATLGSGRELWDALGARFDIVSFAAGHTGPSAGLYSEKLLESAADFAGANIAARGLARDIVAGFGGIPVSLGEGELKGSLAGANIVAAEMLFAPEHAVAHWGYRPGLNAGGMMLSVDLRRSFFANLSRSEQVTLIGLIAETHAASMAEAIGRQKTLARLDSMRRWPVATMFPASLQADIEQATTMAVEAIAARDELSAQIVASHRAFRGGFDDAHRLVPLHVGV